MGAEEPCATCYSAIVIGLAGLLWLVIRSWKIPKRQFSALDLDSTQPTLVPNRYAYQQLKNRKCLVTGGCGFLGRQLVQVLRESGARVSVLDVAEKSPFDREVQYIRADLRKKADVERAVTQAGSWQAESTTTTAAGIKTGDNGRTGNLGPDVVFHCASPSPHGQNKKLFHEVNVLGTQYLLEVCKLKGVKAFVFTSSASVIFSGEDQKGVDDSTAKPALYRDYYCQTKSEAEDLVLGWSKSQRGDPSHKRNSTTRTDDAFGLQTVSIRPHGIFGPGDLQFVPMLVEVAKKGKNKYQIGDGTNLVDFTFVGNVVHAHLLAAEKLLLVSLKDSESESRVSAQCSGQAFLITNDNPVSFWQFLSMILVGLGYDSPSIAIPYKVAYVLSVVTETVLRLLSPIVHIDSTFTPSRIQLAGLYHYYSCEKAKRLLDYRPIYTLEEGLRITLKYFQHLRSGKEGESIVKGSELAHSTSNSVKRGKSSGTDTPRRFTAEEVSKHCTAEDLWLIVDNKVYDVTEFVPSHPGGDAILNDAGGDATEGVHGDHHPVTVLDAIEQFYIGDLQTE